MKATSECFVTESYLADQYVGLVNEEIVDKKTGEYRRAKWEDGLVVPSFRLPTREEYDLVTAASDLSGDIYLSGPYAYQISKKDFILPWWNEYFKVTERGIGMEYWTWIGWNEEEQVVVIPSSNGVLTWPETVLEWCLDSKLKEEDLSVKEIYKAYGLSVKPYSDIRDKVEGDESQISKNKFGKMPYRIFRADENGPEIVEIGEGILLPDEDNYLYDPSTNTVVSDHYDRVFTCFRYMVSAIKK